MKSNYTISPELWQVNDSATSKLIQIGNASLTNVELLSVASGAPKPKVQKLLESANNNLHIIAKMNIDLLQKYLTNKQAASISAVFEIGRRRHFGPELAKTMIRSSQDSFKLLEPHLCDLSYEEFWILLLDRRNQYIDMKRISQGGIAGTVTDIRLIMNFAISKLASGIILAHNHPSGNLEASQADINLTKKLKEGAIILDLQILDHLIISNSNYLSFADDGLL